MERLEKQTHTHTHITDKTHTNKKERDWKMDYRERLRWAIEKITKFLNLKKIIIFQVKEGSPEGSNFRNQKSPKIPLLKRLFSKVLLPKE